MYGYSFAVVRFMILGTLLAAATVTQCTSFTAIGLSYMQGIWDHSLIRLEGDGCDINCMLRKFILQTLVR